MAETKSKGPAILTEGEVDGSWGTFRDPSLFYAKLLEDGTYCVQDPDGNREIVEADEFNNLYVPVSEVKK